jgi:hypothetical protein
MNMASTGSVRRIAWQCTGGRTSGGRDALSARPLRTAAFRVGHLLSFIQLVEGGALNTLRVEEQILVAVRLDEPEPFVRQLLDAAYGHLLALSVKPGTCPFGKGPTSGLDCSQSWQIP